MTFFTDEVDAVDVSKSLAAPGPYLWNRAGELREIPPAVWENTKWVLDEGQSLVENNLLEEMPKHWALVYWEQTVPLLPLSDEVKLGMPHEGVSTRLFGG